MREMAKNEKSENLWCHTSTTVHPTGTGRARGSLLADTSVRPTGTTVWPEQVPECSIFCIFFNL